MCFCGPYLTVLGASYLACGLQCVSIISSDYDWNGTGPCTASQYSFADIHARLYNVTATPLTEWYRLTSWVGCYTKQH
ncbi:hypothetical protein CALCODRAFT_498230 [Calocera cornea HHB12733]|uniref:Uncharacterized protein n=1 Tax=Calocera cornea HHB12733 TaxID=1353952 RepID=A0A165EY01_9BASI|nr:hypothetical protein CALCODRAFT_498230 [Calocera cornea HHB12733]